MPKWTEAYVDGLQDHLDNITAGLAARLEAVAAGRTAPSVDDIAIGSGRKVQAAVLVFDIRGFTNRTRSSDPEQLTQALYMLDCVIPMVMRVIFDHGGYVEKNTGDGVMAILGIGADDATRANTALDVATKIFYILREIVNPHLESEGIEPVDARIGIGMGTILLARIGAPKGQAKHDRSHLTAVGFPANVAARLQQWAGTNEIWVDDRVRISAAEYRAGWFQDRTPDDWNRIWTRTREPFRLWRYTGVRNVPGA